MTAKPRFLTDKKGKPTHAVLAIAEYERLLRAAEDAEDLADLVAVREALARGGEELVPDQVVGRLVAGEHPVRVWRAHRGLSQAALAEAAGISRPYLSQIERRRRDGTLDTMARLARALGVDLDDLAPVNQENED